MCGNVQHVFEHSGVWQRKTTGCILWSEQLRQSMLISKIAAGVALLGQGLRTDVLVPHKNVLALYWRTVFEDRQAGIYSRSSGPMNRVCSLTLRRSKTAPEDFVFCGPWTLCGNPQRCTTAIICFPLRGRAREGCVPQRLNEYAGLVLLVYVLVHVRRESSTCGWVGWLSTRLLEGGGNGWHPLPAMPCMRHMKSFPRR